MTFVTRTFELVVLCCAATLMLPAGALELSGIDLRSRVLDEISPEKWRLRAGPLMRRYLDGYLPMQAQLQARRDDATWDITFAGRLTTLMVLQRP